MPPLLILLFIELFIINLNHNIIGTKFDKELMSRRNYQAKYWLKADFTSLKKEGYKVIKELGRGGYGIVYKAEHANNKNDQWAIKINFNTISRDNICIEIAMLSLMRNKNRLALMKEIVVEKNIYYIILEYFPCSSFISYFSNMGFTEIKHYLYQLLLGLKQLKEIGVYHRDIKPANFLYNRQAKRGIIVDFGLAELDWKFVENFQSTFKQQYGSDIDELEGEQYNRYKTMKKTNQCYQTIRDCLKSIGINKVGTESFVPLETILEIKGQDYSSDMWPVGIIFLQLISKRYTIFSNLKIPMDGATIKARNTYFISFILELAVIFGQDKVRKQLQKWGFEVQLPQLQKFPLQDMIVEEYRGLMQGHGMDFLTRVLDLQPITRLKVEEALNHPFFADIADEHKDDHA